MTRHDRGFAHDLASVRPPERILLLRAASALEREGEAVRERYLNEWQNVADA